MNTHAVVHGAKKLVCFWVNQKKMECFVKESVYKWSPSIFFLLPNFIIFLFMEAGNMSAYNKCSSMMLIESQRSFLQMASMKMFSRSW